MNIKACRERRGITQAKLADELLIDRTTVVKWETGDSAPRAAMLPKLAEALGVGIAELFAENEGESKTSA